MSELSERIAEMKAQANERWAKREKAAGAPPPRQTPWGPDEGAGSPGDFFETMKAAQAMEVDDPARTPEVGQFQAACDDMMLAFRIGVHDQDWQGNPEGLRRWLMDESDLGVKYNSAFREVAKAMDEGTATEGGNWVPTTFSPRLHEQYRLPTKVAGLFEEVPCKSNVHEESVDGPDLDARKGAETDSDDVYANASLMPAITPTTYKATFTAVDIQARISISSQLEADSVVRVVEKRRQKLQVAHAKARDRAILMGDDVTVPYPDADVAADPAVATRSERLWEGLRALVNAGATINCNGVNVTLNKIRDGVKEMGIYGADPSDCVIIAGVRAKSQLMRIPELITLDQYGPNATVLKGEIGSIDGMSVVISEVSKEDVSATGFNTAGGPNTFLNIFIVNVKSFAYGLRERLSIISVPLPLSRQVSLASFERGDFQPMVYDATAVNPVAMLRNIPR